MQTKHKQGHGNDRAAGTGKRKDNAHKRSQ